MAPVPDLERSRADRRGESVHLDGVARAGAQVVERDAHLPCRGDRVAMGAEQLRQVPQHLQDFALLIDLGGAQRVTELDDLGRLQEDGGAGGRLVVHDAPDAGAGGRADGDHVAALPHGDGRIGGAVRRIEGGEHGVEPLYQTGARLPHRAAGAPASRWSSSFGGGSTLSAAVRGAAAASRPRWPATTRAAASARPSCASPAPSSALPGTPNSSRAAATSGTGSARIASSERRRAASSATCASAARMASASVAGERPVTRAAPSGPAACAATRSSAAENSSVSRTEGATPPPTIIRRPPAPRGRSDLPACRPPDP